MTAAATLDRAQSAWRELWRNADAAVWDSGPVTFLPFDLLAVLSERAAIDRHWRERRSEYRFVEDRWTSLAEWPAGNYVLVAAEVQVDLEHRAEIETRALTLTVVLDAGPELRLRHLGEAAPAALLGMLAAYQREALL
jgi:hypothetical protein